MTDAPMTDAPMTDAPMTDAPMTDALPTGTPPLFFLAAGEPSGDILGGRLMAALRRQTGDRIAFAGIGGPKMTEQGLESLFPMRELSVMGIAEIATKIPHLLGRIRQTADAVLKQKPAALVTIDAPDFSFRVAQRVGAGDIPRIHYVAPSVWAWRPGRAAKIAKCLDHLLALFPFEPPWFEVEGLPCSFVGHPAIEGGAGKGDGAAFRARHAIPADQKIIVMLPGSRHGELNRMLPVFVETLRRLEATAHTVSIVVPAPAHLAQHVSDALAGAGLRALVIQGDDEKFDAFAAATAALAKSGTVTLELALSGVPSVIAYRINRLTHAVASRIATGKYAGLPNVVLDRPLMPEFLQYTATPDALTGALVPLLTDSAARRAQVAGAAEVRRLLEVPGTTPSDAAAEVVLRVAREKQAQRASTGTKSRRVGPV
jgi:lipid-A-disaccharide synthase